VISSGIFPGVSYEEYASWPGLRSSYLRHFRRTPAHAYEASVAPEQPSAAMDLGTAIHTAVLEPGAFEKRYARAIKVDRRTTAGKAEWAAFEAEHAGKAILAPDEWDHITRIRQSVWRQPWAEKLLGGKGATELSVRWVDPELQVLCKARIDRYCPEFRGLATVVDLKSTRDAGREPFKRDIENFNYGLQAAFYLDGLAAVSGHHRRWMWIAVEKLPPYAAALYEPDDEVLDEGRRLYRSAIAMHLECERTGEWPGYSPEPQIIGRPAWARRQMEDAAL